MVVPEGWGATSSAGIYELTRLEDGAAAHVSVYGRRDSPLSEDEARHLIGQFVERLSPAGEVAVAVLPESVDQHRAVARCSDGEYDWLVFLVLWREHFLMCSCTAAPGSSVLAEAEMMFASIHQPEPEPARKRLWRR